MTMAKKANIFTEDWNDFHDIAVNLRHLLALLPWQLKMANDATQRTLSVLERQGHKNNFGAATGLTIIDVFRNRDRDEFTYRAPLGKRDTSGEEIEIVMNEVQARFNNSVVVSLHEAFERFVRGVFGKMLYQLRKERPLANKKAFHASQANNVQDEGTMAYYQRYAEWSCRRNCRKAFQFFDKELDWTPVLQPDWRGIRWRDVSDLLNSCRNIIVHNEGRVTSKTMVRLPPHQREFLQFTISQSSLTGKMQILFEKDTARCFLEAAATVPYICYYLLSRRFNMNLDVELWPKKQLQQSQSI